MEKSAEFIKSRESADRIKQKHQNLRELLKKHGDFKKAWEIYSKDKHTFTTLKNQNLFYPRMLLFCQLAFQVHN